MTKFALLTFSVLAGCFLDEESSASETGDADTALDSGGGT